MTKQNTLGRRTFLKCLAGGAALASGCRVVYEDGVQVARLTDGKLEDSTTQYFSYNGSVNTYDPEMADLINETWVKEFGQSIDDHVLIEYVPQVPGGHDGHYDYDREVEWKRLREVRHKIVRVKQGHPAGKSYIIFAHELGHQMELPERIPQLTAYRLASTANIHFPDFGSRSYATLYYVVQEDFARLIRGFCWGNDTPQQHKASTLAVMLALNKNNADFSATHNDLRFQGQGYMQLAHDFRNFCQAQQDVEGVTFAQNWYAPEIGTANYTSLAIDDLLNVTAHQVITRHIKNNPTLSPEQKNNLNFSFKLTANRASSHQYKEGWQCPFIFYPSDYDYSIPKGDVWS